MMDEDDDDDDDDYEDEHDEVDGRRIRTKQLRWEWTAAHLQNL